MYQGNQRLGLEYIEKGLAINKEIGNKSGIAQGLYNIGAIYFYQGNYPRAIAYCEEGLAIFEEMGAKRDIAGSLSFLGQVKIAQSNYPAAMEYCEKSLALHEEIGDKQGMAGDLVNIGEIYNKQGKFSSAMEYYQSAQAIFEEIGDKRGMAGDLGNIGKIYNKQGDYPKALEYCKKSLRISEETGSLNSQKYACDCLYDTYKAMGKGNEALVYMEKIKVIDDSLHSEETAKKLQQMEFAKQMLQDSIAQAETDRLVQEAHEEEVRQGEKTRNIALGAGGFLLLLAGGLYTRVRYIRKSKATLQVEKDRSENLLLNILPKEIAQELKIYGKAEARDFDLVSILFTDFKGFTEQSAKLSAAELVHEINHCFEAFDGIIEKYNVEKIKTIGDAYMAAGGLPVPTDDSVKNTVLAALEMQAFIVKRKSEFDAQISSPMGRPGGARFEMRVGIHTGPVVAGIVGVKKFQYDIWGDTVNTASRIESNGEAGRVNISQATYELLKYEKDLTFESRGKIEAKGKGEMEMLFVSLKK